MNRLQKKQLRERIKQEMLMQQRESEPSVNEYENSLKKMVYVTNMLSLVSFIPLLAIWLVVCFKCLQVVMKLDIVSMLTK